MNLRVVYAALLIALPALLQAATPDDAEPRRPQPRIRVERLDMPAPGEAPRSPYEAPDAPPTLNQEQQGTIFELWFPDGATNRFPAGAGDSRPRNRRAPTGDQ